MMNKKGIGLKPLVMGLVLIVLFVFFMLSFVGNTIQTKNPNSEILSSKYKLNESISTMNSQITLFNTQANGTKNLMQSATTTGVGSLFLIFKEAFTIPKAFLSFTVNSITVLTETIFPSLNGTTLGSIISIILAILISSIVITIVFLIVKAVRTGEFQK